MRPEFFYGGEFQFITNGAKTVFKNELFVKMVRAAFYAAVIAGIAYASYAAIQTSGLFFASRSILTGVFATLAFLAACAPRVFALVWVMTVVTYITRFSLHGTDITVGWVLQVVLLCAPLVLPFVALLAANGYWDLFRGHHRKKAVASR